MKNKKAVITLILIISLLNIMGVEAYQQNRGQGVKGQGVNKISTDSRKRIALVIGNSSYQDSPLKNPVNDAKDMAQALKDLGFTVELRVDASREQMLETIDKFGEKIESNSVVLFYYAGHGVQSNGNNYLIPVNATVAKESELEYRAINAGIILSKMEGLKDTLNIVILDACRNNPYSRSFRSANTGLAQMKAPTGTLIAYATQPGAVASDGDGRNGLYTQEFLKVMKKPGLKIEEVFKEVRRSVITITNQQQTPWDSSSLVGDFSFVESKNTTLDNTVSTEEREYWKEVDKTKVGELKLYLKKYPKGIYADLAEEKIKNLTEGVNNKDSRTNNNVGNILKAGTTMTDDPTIEIKMVGEFVYIPAGNFGMGSTNGDEDEKPIRNVIISQSFEMGKYEVTQEQWEAVMGSNPSYFKINKDLPVEKVSWNDVQQFIKVLNIKSRKYIYRLPTEAEWEYAARAESRGDYAGNLNDIAWYDNNSEQSPHLVRKKQPNAWNLYDMYGNVWEWCSDWYGKYSSGVVTDPSGASSGSERVFRGGSWNSTDKSCRSANRSSLTPDDQGNNIGFRLVRTAR